MMPGLSSARDWMDRDMACHGMDFGTCTCTTCTSSTGSTCTCGPCPWIVLFVCFLTLTAIAFAYHVVFRRVLSSTEGYFFRATRSVTSDDVDVDDDSHATTTVMMEGVRSCDKSASMTMMRPKKFNYRVLYVIRRTNPLYWDHPLLCREEYQFASRILSPARFFVKAGRAMPAILEEEERVDSMEETIANDDDDELVEDMDWEPTRDVKIFFCDEDAPLRDDRGGVHFLPQLLTPGTSTTHVPRDEANEIVFAGRARSSIPEAGEAHFLQDPVHVSVAVTSTNIVPRDDADGVARGCRIHNSDCDCEIDAQGCDMIETKDGQIEIKIICH